MPLLRGWRPRSGPAGQGRPHGPAQSERRAPGRLWMLCRCPNKDLPIERREYVHIAIVYTRRNWFCLFLFLIVGLTDYRTKRTTGKNYRLPYSSQKAYPSMRGSVPKYAWKTEMAWGSGVPKYAWKTHNRLWKRTQVCVGKASRNSEVPLSAFRRAGKCCADLRLETLKSGESQYRWRLPRLWPPGRPVTPVRGPV